MSKKDAGLQPLKLTEDGGCGDTLSVKEDYGGMLEVEVDEPWSGDSVTGIGRTAAVRISVRQAKELAQYLSDWVAWKEESHAPYTAKAKGIVAGDGKPCPNDHDPDCRWPACNCRNPWPYAAKPETP